MKIVVGIRRYRFRIFLLFAWLVGIGLFHTFKPLPPGLDYRGENRDGTCTVDFEEFADDSIVKTLVYRLQEFTGFCSY